MARNFCPSFISTSTVDSSECSFVENQSLSLMMGSVMPRARQTQAATMARLNRKRRPPSAPGLREAAGVERGLSSAR